MHVVLHRATLFEPDWITSGTEIYSSPLRGTRRTPAQARIHRRLLRFDGARALRRGLWRGGNDL